MVRSRARIAQRLYPVGGINARSRYVHSCGENPLNGCTQGKNTRTIATEKNGTINLDEGFELDFSTESVVLDTTFTVLKTRYMGRVHCYKRGRRVTSFGNGHYPIGSE